MDSLSKKIQNLGVHDIRNAARFAQNMIVQYEPYQVDIRRATNTDAWGPTPKHLEKVLRNRYQVPMYLMTEYTLKRLIDHIATRPKNLYEKARKEYVNYGSEWRVVLKCLIVVEYLLLNVSDGDELNQVRSCLTTHKHILSREVVEYRVRISNDGKMEVHERGIRKKCENILQMLEDSHYLKRERGKHIKNHLKIRQQQEQALYNANTYSASSESTGDFEYVDDDGTSDDEAGYEESNETEASAAHAGRRRSTMEEQRRQRREMLKERIKNSEQQRKKQQQPQPEVPDLIDFDFDGSVGPSSEEGKSAGHGTRNGGGGGGDDEDDDFGDFQGDGANTSKSEPFTVTTTTTTTTTSTNNNNSNLDDLLEFGEPTKNTAPAVTTGATNGNGAAANGDAFADLFSYSKSLI